MTLTPPPAIRALLVDDQNLVRMGISSLLHISGVVEVVAQLEDGSGVLEAIAVHRPDVMLLDIRMPVMSGFDVLNAMHDQGITVPTIVLTTFDEHDLVLECMRLGAKGYLRKDVSLDVVLEAINAVIADRLWIQPAISSRMDQEFPKLPKAEEPLEALTENEVVVLRLVAAGYSNREIALAIHKSEGTIRNQMSSILGKLQARDRTRAVLRAMEFDLI